jgi:hypothetical protein
VKAAMIALFCLQAALPAVSAPTGAPGATSLTQWPEATQTARPWTRWWWPGSAVDRENLTRQLEAFAAAGLGGVEITPIYGARGYEERYLDFLSPAWMEMLRHTGEEAARLGLGVDMTTGTGWPFGGPWVPLEDAAHRILYTHGELCYEPTRQRVKRAAPGGEGWVLDPFSPEALRRYLGRFEEAFADFPDGLLRGQFHDSFEYYGANYTEHLPFLFEGMHGYALADWCAELLGEKPTDPETLARLKADYRVTLHYLHQSYLHEWRGWANRHGWTVRNQSHGAPANLLDLYGMVDIPETEIFGSTPFPIPGLRRDPGAIRQDLDLPEPLVSRMASSAAHVMGRPLVSCETATWLRDHWKVSLAHVKPELDRIFLDGINHVFYHGTVYSPADAPWPGWLFYASTQFHPNNPWWRDFAALNAYVLRVQSVLQGGQPDNDVLIYWPVHDLWHEPAGIEKQLTVHDVSFVLDTPFGATVKGLRDEGHAFDYISDTQLLRSRVEEGHIVTPGSRYGVVVVPPTRHLPVATLDTLLGLAAAGAQVVFETLPEDVPGLGRLEARREDFRKRLESLRLKRTGTKGVRRATFEAGAVWVGPPATILAGLPGVAPEPLVSTGLDFIRRRDAEGGTSYFIANLGAEPVAGWIQLGRPAASAALLDPLDGGAGLAARRTTAEGSTEVYLALEPGESRVLRVHPEPGATGESWTYLRPVGDARALSGSWQLDFISGGPELPQGQVLESPGSWTEVADEEAQRFAGTARYTLRFALPETPEADDWQLDLGDVRESARVSLNGHLVATAWSLPFRLQVGPWLRPGDNLLEIEVTNTAANRIRDLDRRGVDWKIMREINFVNILYRPFDASGWDLEPAGLLGPVTLQALEAFSPAE